MKSLRLGLFALLTPLLILLAQPNPALAEIVSPKDYDFPVKNAYLATILSTLNKASAPYQVIQFHIGNGRQKIPLALFSHPIRKAPLAFVIAGTGGNALGGNALHLASELFNLGYQVITFPNPISADYVYGISESAVPGFLPRDSEEFYGFMEKVEAHLKRKLHASFEGYTVTGFSYGGLLAGFLARVDQERRHFNFDRVAILNPAIDVGYGVDTLDQFYDWGKTLSGASKEFGLDVLNAIERESLQEDFWPEASPRLMSRNENRLAGLSDQVMKWLIGWRFREKLLEVILASQDRKDLGILKPIGPGHLAEDRRKEAARISFHEYMIKFVTPSVLSEDGKPLTPGQVVHQGSLYSLATLLGSLPQIHLFENTDDFLMKSDDTGFLKAMMGERLHLYPYGGHVGNLSFEKNQRDFQSVMSRR